MHGTFNLMAIKNKLVSASVPAGRLAAADWHYNVASLAYQRYQVMLEEAEAERKHQRYLNKVALANQYLEVFRCHTRRGDDILH